VRQPDFANAIGMLPFPLLQLGSDGSRDKAVDHPLYELLTARPNSRHTAFEFRRLMQRWLLIDGNAYALIVSSRGRVTSLVPLPPSRVQVRERPDWTIEYKVRGRPAASARSRRGDPAPARRQRRRHARLLAGRRGGGSAGAVDARRRGRGAAVPQRQDRRDGARIGQALSEEAAHNLRASIEEMHAGAENAHRTLVLEEGLKFKEVGASGRDLQGVESRKHQIEEVCGCSGCRARS
jgi:phage portal protein BeeE